MMPRTVLCGQTDRKVLCGQTARSVGRLRRGAVSL